MKSTLLVLSLVGATVTAAGTWRVGPGDVRLPTISFFRNDRTEARRLQRRLTMPEARHSPSNVPRFRR